MKHILRLAVLLIAAIASYAVGFGAGIVLLIVAGVLFELTFWVLALRGFRKYRSA